MVQVSPKYTPRYRGPRRRPTSYVNDDLKWLADRAKKAKENREAQQGLSDLFIGAQGIAQKDQVLKDVTATSHADLVDKDSPYLGLTEGWRDKGFARWIIGGTGKALWKGYGPGIKAAGRGVAAAAGFTKDVITSAYTGFDSEEDIAAMDRATAARDKLEQQMARGEMDERFRPRTPEEQERYAKWARYRENFSQTGLGAEVDSPVRQGYLTPSGERVQPGVTGTLQSTFDTLQENAAQTVAMALTTPGISDVAKIFGTENFDLGVDAMEETAAKLRSVGVRPDEAAWLAYHSNDLPKFVKGALEIGLDPINLLPIVGWGGDIAKGVKLAAALRAGTKGGALQKAAIQNPDVMAARNAGYAPDTPDIEKVAKAIDPDEPDTLQFPSKYDEPSRPQLDNPEHQRLIDEEAELQAVVDREPLIHSDLEYMRAGTAQMAGDRKGWLRTLIDGMPGVRKITEMERMLEAPAGIPAAIGIRAKDAFLAKAHSVGPTQLDPILGRIGKVFRMAAGESKSWDKGGQIDIVRNALGAGDVEGFAGHGTMKDIMDRPSAYNLNAEQRAVLDELNELNTGYLNYLDSKSKRPLARYDTEPGGVFTSNIEVGADETLTLTDELQALRKARGNKRKYQSAYERWLAAKRAQEEEIMAAATTPSGKIGVIDPLQLVPLPSFDLNVGNLLRKGMQVQAEEVSENILRRVSGAMTKADVVEAIAPGLGKTYKAALTKLKAFTKQFKNIDEVSGAERGFVPVEGVENIAVHIDDAVVVAERKIVVVRLEDGTYQPFYKRTGFGGRSAGAQRGDWVPFDGQAIKNSPMEPGWFNKIAYQLTPDNPLARWGTEANKRIGLALRKMEDTFPAARELSPAEANKWMGVSDDFVKQGPRIGTGPATSPGQRNIYDTVEDFLDIDNLETMRPLENGDLDKLALNLDAIAAKGLLNRAAQKRARALADAFRSTERQYKAAVKLIDEGKTIYKPAVKSGKAVGFYEQKTADVISRVYSHTESNLSKGIRRVKETVFGGDFSPIILNIANGLFMHPRVVGKQFYDAMFHDNGAGIRRAFSRESLAEDMKLDPQWWDDYAIYTGRSPGGAPEEYGGGLMRFLPTIKGFDFGAKFARWNDTLFSMVDRSAKNVFKDSARNYMEMGFPEHLAKAAAAKDAMQIFLIPTGGQLGRSEFVRKLGGNMITSVTFLKRPAEFFENTLRGLAKMGTKGTLTVSEKHAVRRMSILYGTTAFVSSLSAGIDAQIRGRDPVEAAWNALNPKHSSFMTIHAGVRIPIGGPFRAFFKLIAPREMYKDGPVLPFGGLRQFATGRIHPAVSSVIEAPIIGRGKETYTGEQIWSADGEGISWTNALETLAWGTEQVLPLSAGELAQGLRRRRGFADTAQESAFQFFGVNAYFESPYRQRHEIAKQFAETHLSEEDAAEVNGFGDLAPNLQRMLEAAEPELVADIRDEQERQARFGDVRASRQMAAYVLKEKGLEQQAVSDDQLINQLINPEEWRKQRKLRKSAISNQREGIYLTDVNTREPRTPVDFYYQEMERLSEKHNGSMTSDAWDELDRWTVQQSLPDQKYLEENLGGGPYTKTDKAYMRSMEHLEKSGYWAVWENLVEKNPAVAGDYAEYKTQTTSSDEAEYLRNHPELDAAIKRARNARNTLRQRDRVADAIIGYWWGRGGFQHKYNIGRQGSQVGMYLSRIGAGPTK